MRVHNILFLLVISPILASGSSWFGSDKESAPSKWTRDQYEAAQKYFQGVKESTFDTWSESRLREFLLEQGIVAPSGPRESLVLTAKGQYRAYTDAASSLSTSLASRATNCYVQVSKSASSIIAQATTEAARQADAGKDYVYSTWDDNQLRDYLVKRGIIKSKEEQRRDELLAMMTNVYLKATEPIWKAWRDPYIREWLIAHNMIKSDYQKKRDALLDQMAMYYYNVSESVWSTWSEADMKKWLVDHGIIKSDAQIKKEKMLKLIEANYPTAPSTLYGAWKDSDMHKWLVDHGYLRSDAQVTRDELIELMSQRYNALSKSASPYLSWTDSRLRAYLVEIGAVPTPPTTREALLQNVREYWSPPSQSPGILEKLREVVSGSVEAAEEKLGRVREILEDAGAYMTGKTNEGEEFLQEKYSEGERYAEEKSEQVKKSAQEDKERAGEEVKKGGQKLKGEL